MSAGQCNAKKENISCSSIDLNSFLDISVFSGNCEGVDLIVLVLEI